MRDGDTNVLGGLFFFNYKLAERDGAVGICDFEYFVLSFFCFVFFFLLTRRLCQLSACVAMILAPLLVQP